MNNEIYNEKQKGILIIVNIIVLCVVMYASTKLTLNFFGSIGEGDVRDSNWLLGLANDVSKVFLPFCLGIAINKSRYVLATIILVMTVITVYISYMASQGLDLNVATQIENEAIVNDSGYTRNQETYSSSNNTIAELKAKKSSLESSNVNDMYEVDETIISLDSKRKAALAKNWITTPPGSPRTGADVYEEKIIKRKAEIKAQVKINLSKLETQIATQENLKNTSKNELDNTDTSKIAITSGYHNLAKSMGTTVDKIVKFKNLAQEALCLLLSMTLGLLSGNASFKINNFFSKFKKIIGFFKKNDKDKTIEKEKIIENLLSKDVVVAKCETKNNKYRNVKLRSMKNFGCIDKESVAKYLAIAETTRKENNEISGIVALSKLSKITESKGKSITGYLKYLGIIESINRKTYLVKNEKEYKKILEIS